MVVNTARRGWAFYKSHDALIQQSCLVMCGVALVCFGLVRDAEAQHGIRYNSERIDQAVGAMFTYLEGSFGALVMVSSGVGAILSAAFGQYRASLGLMVVSIGAFILRSLTVTFFNYSGTP